MQSANITFWDGSFGYSETLAGRAGAGLAFAGASVVHTHMTNTRITDPEVLEVRYPERLERFEIRRGKKGLDGFSKDGMIPPASAAYELAREAAD